MDDVVVDRYLDLVCNLVVLVVAKLLVVEVKKTASLDFRDSWQTKGAFPLALAETHHIVVVVVVVVLVDIVVVVAIVVEVVVVGIVVVVIVVVVVVVGIVVVEVVVVVDVVEELVAVVNERGGDDLQGHLLR